MGAGSVHHSGLTAWPRAPEMGGEEAKAEGKKEKGGRERENEKKEEKIEKEKGKEKEKREN